MDWCKKVSRSILIGLLFGAGFIVPVMWWTVVIGVGYYVWLLEREQIGVWGSLIAWTTKYLLALWWFWSVYPIDWIGVDLGALELIGIGFYWFTASLWLGSGGVLFVWLYRKIKNRWAHYAVWSVPALCLLSELGGALVFSIITYGAGASIGMQFSFGFIGYHLAQHDALIALSGIAGAYGLTMVVGFISVLGLWLCQRQQWKVVVGAVCLLVLSHAIVGQPSQPENSSESISVAVVDTAVAKNYWQTASGTNIKQAQLQAAYEAAQSLPVDFIVFPEDSRLFDQSVGTNTLRSYLSFTSANNDPVVIESGRVETAEGALLQAVLFDPRTDDIAFAHKRYLVPQGEFMPSLYYGSLHLFGFSEVASFLDNSFTYVVGEQVTQSHFSSSMPGVLFCFESVDPRGVRKLQQERNHGLPFVAHVVSHGWFTDPHTLLPQLEAMLRVQAIWNDTYIVSAGNHVRGYTVTPEGDVVLPEVLASGEQWQVGIIELPKR